MHLIDPTHEFLEGDSADRQLIIKHTQNIPQGFLDGLREARLESSRKPMGDFHRFASIPTAVVEKWGREGFDVMKESAKSIIAKLRGEDLDSFITTNKAL
jgi:hypothetical protein